MWSDCGEHVKEHFGCQLEVHVPLLRLQVGHEAWPHQVHARVGVLLLDGRQHILTLGKVVYPA